MQIGQLQDEDDESSNVLTDEVPDNFRNSTIGMLISADKRANRDNLDILYYDSFMFFRKKSFGTNIS